MKKLIIILLFLPLFSQAQFKDTVQCRCKITQPIQLKNAIVYNSITTTGIILTQVLVMQDIISPKDGRAMTYGLGVLSLFTVMYTINVGTEPKSGQKVHHEKQ